MSFKVPSNPNHSRTGKAEGAVGASRAPSPCGLPVCAARPGLCRMVFAGVGGMTKSDGKRQQTSFKGSKLLVSEPTCCRRPRKVRGWLAVEPRLAAALARAASPTASVVTAINTCLPQLLP